MGQAGKREGGAGEAGAAAAAGAGGPGAGHRAQQGRHARLGEGRRARGGAGRDCRGGFSAGNASESVHTGTRTAGPAHPGCVTATVGQALAGQKASGSGRLVPREEMGLALPRGPERHSRRRRHHLSTVTALLVTCPPGTGGGGGRPWPRRLCSQLLRVPAPGPPPSPSPPPAPPQPRQSPAMYAFVV